MQKLSLNKTPMRTSENYGINDIKLDIDIPKIKEFNNFSLIMDQNDKERKIELNEQFENNELISKIGLKMQYNKQIEIIVPKDTIIDKPIILNFDFDKDNLVLVENINIVFEENSRAEFVLKYSCINDNDDKNENSNENLICFHNLKQETYAKENSKGIVTILNYINNKSNSFIAIENKMETNSDIQYNLIELGGKNKISNYYAELVGDNSKNIVKNIYLGAKDEIIDINYNIDIVGKENYCNIESYGALKENAKKNFKGTIDFKEGCKKSTGIENENCMILSDSVKAKSLPMLLCHEEDVIGEHGVSSGKLDEQKIFYIMTKGISYDDARKLIVEANFSKIINDIKCENSIREKVNQLI